ncbi:LAFE_0G07558g1_1 [Lachancea fermentati]|uniref:LAFE_0G07558g1_1 n=1 Tax=Lachancea fermentati TaxID=4955 RepID=A0A1G4MHD0_LACFM|nr:LAFE_0G07558g1_1 [Lachancea fermentati]
MDEDLKTRLGNLKEKLNCGNETKVVTVPKSEAARLVNKYKFKPKERSRKNRFLPEKLQKFQKLYSNSVEEAENKFPDFKLYSRADFEAKVRQLADVTAHRSLGWDRKWLNPIQIVSRGWHLYTETKTEGSILALRCKCCHSLLYLDLEESSRSSSANESYHNMLKSQHTIDCPWSNHKYDLEQNYNLSRASLFLEVQRIIDKLEEVKHFEFALPIEVQEERKVSSLFDVEDQQLSILAVFLRGYSFITKDVVECNACGMKCFVTTLRDKEYNGHAIWCKYEDESKLKKLLVSLQDESLQREVKEVHESRKDGDQSNDLQDRLKWLERYFKTI